MWHDMNVRSLAALLFGLLLPCAEIAAAQGKHSPTTSPTTSKTSAQNPVAAALSAEQGAVAGGDPVQIRETASALAGSLLRELATARMAEGHREEAVELQQRAIDLKPSPIARLELASMLLRSRQPAKATDEARKVTEAEPDDAVAWTVLGSALRTAGKDKEAADAFEHSLKIHSDASVAYAMGSALLAAHEKPAADRTFARIIRGSDNDPVWLVAVGDAYRDAGYFDDAVAQFKAAIARDPRAIHAEFFLGLTYLQMNQWGPSSQSFEHLRNATRLNPHEYVSNFYLGALESTDGSDLASSDAHLKAAAEADSSQPEVWLYLGLNANREKRTADAKQYFQKAIALTGPDESRNNYMVRRAYFALGRILIAEGNRTEGNELLAKYSRAEQAAVAESGAAIASRDENHTAAAVLASSTAAATIKTSGPDLPTDATAKLSAEQRNQLTKGEFELQRLLASTYNDLGTASARQQQYGDALLFFQQAERWNGTDPAVLRNLASAAFRTENYAETVRALTQFEKSDAPLDNRLRLMMAYSQFSLGRFGDAAKSFGSARDATLQDTRSAYSWAFSLARSGQQPQAIQIADQLVTRDPPPDVLNLVCHLYVDTEDFEQITGCYRKLLAMDTSFKLAHYQVGEALIRLDRPAEAIPELRKELELSPGNANVESALAFALLQTSQKDEARTLLAAVTSTTPDLAEAQYEYGKLLAEDGHPADAIAHLEAAERLEPEKDYIRYQLQSAYRRLGRTEDAAREAAAYREIKDKHRDDAARPRPDPAQKP